MSLRPFDRSGLEVIAGERKLLKRALALERTQNYQSQFEELDQKGYECLAAQIHNIHTQTTEHPISVSQLRGHIHHADLVFRGTYRDNILDGVRPHTLSHMHTPALFAAAIGLPARTIIGIYEHDTAEEILDILFESQQGIDHIKSLRLPSLAHMIYSGLREHFPPSGVKARTIVQDRLEDYKNLRNAVLHIIGKKMHLLSEDMTGLSLESIISLIDGVTVIPGEPYNDSIARIHDVNTSNRPLRPHYNDLDLDSFQQYIIELRNNTLETKALDGLHNLETQPPLVIPDIGENVALERQIDKRLKSLMKRLYVIDYGKELILENMVDGILDSSYADIYRLHLLLAAESAREAEKTVHAVEETFAHRLVTDPHLMQEYGKNRPMTFGEIFTKIRNAQREYERRGLMDRVSSVVTIEGTTYILDDQERAFYDEHRVWFAGTIKRIRAHADKRGPKTLYHGFESQPNVVDFYRDTYAMQRVFERYLCKDHEGQYDPSLMHVHMMGLGNS